MRLTPGSTGAYSIKLFNSKFTQSFCKLDRYNIAHFSLNFRFLIDHLTYPLYNTLKK